jgi:hypothetical protein
VAAVRAATGWDLAVAGDLRRTDPPSAKELAVMRRLVDPGKPDSATPDAGTTGYRTDTTMTQPSREDRS